jgi:hypothetical protein
MPHRIRTWIIILVAMSAVPLSAQEWVYCPAAPEELERQCGQTENTIRRNRDLISTVGDQMRNPEIILAKVNRPSGESVMLYQARVKQQQGVATPASNRWLPIRGRYYDPDQQIIYVAVDRPAYWQYIWETLAPDEDLARRTFTDRERLSQQFKQTRFTGPDGKLAQWQQEIETAQRFRQQCCSALAIPEVSSEMGLSGKEPRP